MAAVAKFPVVDPSIKGDDDRRLADAMSAFLQSEMVRRLRESALFDRVVNLSETEYRPDDGKGLKLDGEITRLDEGSQTLRAMFGVYGGGAARVRPRRHHRRPLESGQVVIVTADRRQATMGIWGGVSEDHIRNALDDIARDLTKFLVRLSKGQARGAVAERDLGRAAPSSCPLLVRLSGPVAALPPSSRSGAPLELTAVTAT